MGAYVEYLKRHTLNIRSNTTQSYRLNPTHYVHTIPNTADQL